MRKRSSSVASNVRALAYVNIASPAGQQVVLLDELDMVTVVLVDPLHMQWGDEPWRIEKANLNLVADFIASLPKSDGKVCFDWLIPKTCNVR